MPSKKSRAEWNARHYTQINVSMDKELAGAFKASCAEAGVTIASEIKMFMESRCGVLADSSRASRKNRPSTRGTRRKEAADIALRLQKLLDEEEQYLERIPDNLQGGSRAEDAAHSVSHLTDALDALLEAY
jgi:hypothetical protein